MILGCDVSSAQGRGWRPPSGFDFVYVKATEGVGYENPYHDDQVKAGHDARLVVGHYHVIREGSSVTDQVKHFLRYANLKEGEFLVLDWERWGSNRIIVPTGTKDAFLRHLLKAEPSTRSGLYCNTDTWLHVDTSSFTGSFLAIADYTPGPPGITAPWLIHQYTNGGGLDKNRAKFDNRKAMLDWANGIDAPVTVKWAPVSGPAAVAAAKSWFGKPYGIGWCQKFTNELFGTGTVGDFDQDSDFDAVDGWKAAVANGKVIRASSISSYAEIPPAVMLYWSGGSHGFGHAAVSIGGGRMVSTDLPVPGVVGNVPITMPHEKWGLDFVGYVTKEGNGYTLIDTGGQGGGTKPKPPPVQEDNMEHKLSVRNTDSRFAKANTWQWLRIDDKGAVSFLSQPGKVVAGFIELAISGLGEGQKVELYEGAFDVNRSEGKTIRRVSNLGHPVTIDGNKSGSVTTRIPFDWVLGDQAKGFGYRALRFQVRSTTTNAIIRRSEVSGWMGK
jgi:hypothetical protein